MLGISESRRSFLKFGRMLKFNDSILLSLQLFARGGYSVTLFDVVADQLQAALAAIERQLKMLEGDGLLREGQTAAGLMGSVSVSSDLREAMEGADYVQVAAESVNNFLG